MTTRAVADEKALDRVTFFSDAVFAIAMTLLVLDLRIPIRGTDRQLWHQLARQENSRRYDDRLLWLNLTFLFCIALLPFPTAVLGRDGGRAATVLYASAMSVTGVLSWLLTYDAYGRHRLIDPDKDPAFIRVEVWRSAALPLVFLPSIAVAFASPVAARGMWLLGFVTTVALERIRRRRHAGPVIDKPLHPSGQ
jgi:uncharacterized membrane protein